MAKKSGKSRASKPVYKRIILKLSGEVLKGTEDVIDPAVANNIAHEVAEIHGMGVQVAIVIGGGNIWRGITSANRGMDRSTADYMGMLATIINGMALQEALEKAGVNTRVQTAIEVKNVAEPFIRRRAVRHLEKGPRGDFCGGHGQSVFLHRHGRGAARERTGRGNFAEGDEGRRHLRQRSAQEPEGEKVHAGQIHRGAGAPLAGDGLDRVRALHG